MKANRFELLEIVLLATNLSQLVAEDYMKLVREESKNLT